LIKLSSKFGRIKNLNMRNMDVNDRLLAEVKEVIVEAKKTAWRSTNTVLLKMYWRIGQLIVDHEQGGREKAVYGHQTLKNLSSQLTLEFGKGFDFSNLTNMRKFYLAFPILDAVRQELSWTHYRIISRIENQELRNKYVQYAIEGGWNTRTLQRNIDSQYLGRVLEVRPDEQETIDTKSLIKDPYIFEFLGFPNNTPINENNLETALIDHLKQFLMELGKGFAFVGRQEHIITDTSDFYIDLVFYNYYLKCFVLVDIKTDELSPAAIGQMDMYVRMYNDLKRSPGDNPTIGIILCAEKDQTIARYSVLSENQHLFASKYRLYLPSERELQQLIDQDRMKLTT
jgi:predicted nuclease of restriction endonuclease-like (RecB) superfamily